MTKRILALLLAVLLICTAFVGCKKDGKDGDATPATPKAQFVDSLAKTMLGTSDFTMPSVDLSGDMKADIQVNLNKLSVAGKDYLTKGAVDAAIGVAMDGDSGLFEVNASATMAGETPTIKAVLGEDGVYLTDLLGINDKPVLVSFAEMGMDSAEFSEALGMMDDATALAQSILDALTASLEKNIPESVFVAETKDVTVGGTEFKGATVISATLTSAMAENIVIDLANALANNETFKAMAGEEINPEDIKGQLPQGELVLVNTIADNVTVGLEAKLYQGTAADGTELGSLVGSFLTTGTNLALNVPSEDMKIVLDTKVDASGNATAALSVTSEGETITPVKAEGTYKDGKFDGTVTVDIEGQSITIDCSAQASATGFSLSITEIGMNMQGMNMSLPMELTVSGTAADNKETLSVVAKFDYQGMISIDGSITVTSQTSDVTVSPVTGAVSINEVDASAWSQQLMTKYPAILEFISGMMTQSMDADVAVNSLY